MTTIQNDSPAVDQVTFTPQELETKLARDVLHALEPIDDLSRITVRHLWSLYFRVNVFTRKEAASAVVAYSYFVQVDSGGTILKSVPTITRIPTSSRATPPPEGTELTGSALIQ